MKNSLESIVLGGGCFWCLDATYSLIKGVEKRSVGFAGGNKDNPTYKKVSYGLSDHAEVIKIDFNSSVISLESLLDVFWAIHDPTTLNRQGNDVGPQYRSIILYNGDNQRDIVEQSFNAVNTDVWGGRIVTEIRKLDQFYPAEEYHQDYFAKNPQAGYCQVVINPKLQKLQKQFTSLLK